MINQFLKDRLFEMAHMINELKVQREQIEAGFDEPDVCADCKFSKPWRQGEAGEWCCSNSNSPLVGYRFRQPTAHKLCCIYYESRKPEEGDNV